LLTPHNQILVEKKGPVKCSEVVVKSREEWFEAGGKNKAKGTGKQTTGEGEIEYLKITPEKWGLM